MPQELFEQNCYQALIGPYVAACLGLLPRKEDNFYLFVIEPGDWKLGMEEASNLKPAELRARYLELGGNRDAFRIMLENVGCPSDCWLLNGAPCLLAALAMRTIPDET